jgi:hypothetical protein
MGTHFGCAHTRASLNLGGVTYIEVGVFAPNRRKPEKFVKISIFRGQRSFRVNPDGTVRKLVGRASCDMLNVYVYLHPFSRYNS